MTAISSSLNIDAALGQAFGVVQDDATKDLRNVIDEISANSDKKEVLRSLSDQLAVAKAAVNGGNHGKAHQEINKLLRQLEAAGYDKNSALGKVASEIPKESGGNPDGDMQINSMSWSEDAIKSTNGWLDSIETSLKSEMDRSSDISSKLQVEMNTKSSILRRAEKGVADNASAFQKNGDALLRNMKG